MHEPSLPSVGLGTAGNTDPDRCRETVETGLAVGYRHIDTAQMYDNESAVGAGLANSPVARESVVVATKVHPSNLASDDVIESTAESLDRLGLDTIDLLYVHWPIDAYDPADTLPAFDELVTAGHVNAIGVSNFSPALVREAADILEHPIAAHQIELHPLLQQDRLREVAAELGHTVVAYSPIMKGRAASVPELVSIAEKHGATPTEVALAWVTGLEGVVAIPKSTSRDHLVANLASPDLSLDAADIDRIEGIDRSERLVSMAGAPWTDSS